MSKSNTDCKQQSKTRKRIKLECLECRAQFDDDYKSKHEQKHHNGKRVRIKHVGAPANPFEAAKSAKRKRKQSEDDTLLPSEPKTDELAVLSEVSSNETQNLFSPPEHSETFSENSKSIFVEDVVDGDNNLQKVGINDSHKQISTDVNLSQILPPKSNKEVIPHSTLQEGSEFLGDIRTDFGCTTSQNEQNKKKEESSFWLGSIGQVGEFLKNLASLNKIIENLKNEEDPNPKIYLIELIDNLVKINEESKTLIESLTHVQKELTTNDDFTFACNDKEVVEHDPGRRTKITSHSERQYLHSLGPFQPKIDNYPINQEIPIKKQCRFNPSWYQLYPNLEYSIVADAIFCFVCCLFPDGPGRSHSSSE